MCRSMPNGCSGSTWPLTTPLTESCQTSSSHAGPLGERDLVFVYVGASSVEAMVAHGVALYDELVTNIPQHYIPSCRGVDTDSRSSSV